MTQVRSKDENFAPTLFSDIFDGSKFFGQNWLNREFTSSFPAVNIKESNKEYSLEFAAPGFKKEDFKVSVDNDILNISAETRSEKNEDSKKFTRKEFSFNSFSRSFSLPENVNTDGIDAKYENGILNLSIPKKEESKNFPKKEIKIG